MTGEYRRDIDGLRAVAILAILIFHAVPSWLPGGFIGVDIFYVISGYLITTIVVRDQAAGRFTFSGFYLRRAKRIVPAYAATMLVVTAAAVVILMPQALADFGESLTAASLFFSNIHFAGHVDYFDNTTHNAPLLNLWSLAVEEQFYVVWPMALFIVALAPLRRWRAVLFVAGWILSFAFSQIESGRAPASAFYAAPSRAWELLTGALLTLDIVQRQRISRPQAEVAAAIGLGLIVTGLAVITPQAPFPGVIALLPCVGAALVIFAGIQHPTLMASPLRSWPFVQAGLISYSLYLWHWPLLVFARILRGQPLSPPEALSVAGLSIVIAALSWRLVEQPVRAAKVTARTGLLVAAATLGLLAAAGVALKAADGLPGRLKPDVVAMLATTKDFLNTPCHVGGDAPLARPEGCKTNASPGEAAGEYDVLVWGDSHARSVFPGVEAWAKPLGLSARLASRSSCPPLAGARMTLSKSGFDERCADFNAAVAREIAANPRLRYVVLSARWADYTEPPPVDAPMHFEAYKLGRLDRPAGETASLSVLTGQTLNLFSNRSGVRVIILGPLPELRFSPAECIAQRRLVRLSEAQCTATPVQPVRQRLADVTHQLEIATGVSPQSRLVLPAQALCEGAECSTLLDGLPLYFDDNHLTITAARRLIPGLFANAGVLDQAHAADP